MCSVQFQSMALGAAILEINRNTHETLNTFFFNTKFEAKLLANAFTNQKPTLLIVLTFWYKVQIIIICLLAIYILTLEYLGHYKDEFHSDKERLHIVIN